MNRKLMESSFGELGIKYNEEMMTKFGLLMDGILDWNTKVNVTAITDPDEFVIRHFIDSVLCCGLPEFTGSSSVIDIGTGAGFPGLPLAILFSDKRYLLADSVGKKINIVNEMIEKLGLDNTSAVHGRAEDLAREEDKREKYDVCVSRAVSNLSTLSEYCLPFVKVGGSCLAYKGPGLETELKDAQNAIQLLGGKIDRVESVSMNGFDHNIVVIRKVNNTPGKYPRKAGIPTKTPLK